jgi:endonuclease I
MKNTYYFIHKLSFIMAFLFSSFAFSQTTYYKDAFGKKGETLFSTLHDIIDDHTEYPYTSSSTDVWDILKVTDRDTANPDNVILLYSGRSVNAAQEYNSGNGWTREHVWSKSRGDFGTNLGEGTDVHHLRPLDASVNSSRNNRSFDTCVVCDEVVDDGFHTGSFTDQNAWTFEPRDDVKGDVARMIFYMAVRYEGDISGEVDLVLTETEPGQGDKDPEHGVLEVLLEWNEEDPVSDWERNRNDIIYDQFQGNRNPFIDYPELAEYLWGDFVGQEWNNETGINESGQSDLRLYPNPVRDWLYLSERVEVFELFDVSGCQVLHASNVERVGVGDVAPGLYVARVDRGGSFRVVVD